MTKAMTTTNERGAARVRAREDRIPAAKAKFTQAALSLFEERGFDRTTMRDIGEVVGISERTAFRYFKTKDEILVAPLETWRARVVDRLRHIDVTVDLITAYKEAMSDFLEAVRTDSTLVRIQRIVRESPELQWKVNSGNFDTANTDIVLEEIARRLDLPVWHHRAKLVRALIATAAAQAISEWARDPERVDLRAVWLDNVDFLAPLLRPQERRFPT